MMKQRIHWLDNLRAVAIFFVVLGHTVGLPERAYKLIFSFHMPIFFWISGVLAKETIRDNTFSEFIGKRWKTRLIPYVSFSVISYLAWFFLFRHFGTQAALKIDPVRPLIGMVYGNGINNWLVHNTVLWFFLCLFVTEILFFFIIKLPSRVHITMALIAFSIIGYLDTYYHPPDGFRLPWNVDIALTAVVFYGAGFLTKRYVLGDLKTGPYGWVMMLITVMLYGVFSMLNDKVALVAGLYGNYFYFYIAAFSGIFFWMRLSRMIPPVKLLSKIGKNTLTIFALHLLVFPFLTAVQVYIFRIPAGVKHESVLLSLAYAIVSIFILLPVSDLMTKRLPFLLGQPLKSRS